MQQTSQKLNQKLDAAQQTRVDIKSAAATLIHAERAFAKSRRQKLSSQLKSQKAKYNAEKMELALSLSSTHLATWKSLDEDQTQLLQQELAMNRKTIVKQSQELVERGQQLITARLEKEEQSMVARHMAIENENDSEQIDRLRRELDQMKSTMATKNEQIKQLQQERDDIMNKYEVCGLFFFCSNTQLLYLLKLVVFLIAEHRNTNLEWLQKCGKGMLMERMAVKCGQHGVHIMLMKLQYLGLPPKSIAPPSLPSKRSFIQAKK